MDQTDNLYDFEDFYIFSDRLVIPEEKYNHDQGRILKHGLDFNYSVFGQADDLFGKFIKNLENWDRVFFVGWSLGFLG